MRETVHEVEIDAAYFMPAQVFDGSRHYRLTLDPIDLRLDSKIEALHAEARAIYLGYFQRFGHFRRERARVDLDSDGSRFLKSEAAAQKLHQGEKISGRYASWRSTAEMHVADGERLWRLLRDQTDFLT